MYVGAGVTIGPGARVKEAIILDRAEIMVGTCLWSVDILVSVGALLRLALYCRMGL